MMRPRRPVAISLAAIAACALIWPVAGAADHVSIQASAGATLKERAGSGAWKVEVSHDIACIGATRGVVYFGSGSLVDEKTGESHYLGGVSRASGKTTVIVRSRATWRRMRPEFRVSCGEDLGGHGSELIDVVGAGVSIPPLDGDRGTGSGGSGDDPSGAGGDGGDPTDPIRAGGCLHPLVGTEGADTLTGTRAGDVIFGRGGRDVIRGLAGHDCLIGGAGGDTLRGEQGDDRLTGGPGADTLLGGAGVNAYDAGGGNDTVNAVNGTAERVRCGPGRDVATVDRRDRVDGCERVTRVGR